MCHESPHFLRILQVSSPKKRLVIPSEYQLFKDLLETDWSDLFCSRDTVRKISSTHGDFIVNDAGTPALRRSWRQLALI
jgi:hypothetical protein